ncbi:4-hydroxybenzoate octaprenyltransferase [Bermanella marisrubri]|uniref:4-hydroxybenzoate octaprenyltransferase n=1 Tax=Bermanella marisrubri TaxID=207949 RepID=Q1N3Z4_9GAMM|nr:4-hydroxybenzoate octaprenyltransferase [Bermanella marisrubri]EAT13071.1 4-hydroxybenzoate polyprenyl transferase [Oceanobacter sp. RED65] [Bermanella marisrubri]QIZ82813.1 4-hydroxybenzoate octaprenyltransferase [Bermanella marisrubri]
MSWLIDRFPKLPLYWQLTRLNRPIGIYLLLWPTMWALWIAGEGQPSVANVTIFILGVVLMRSAGCVINDYADRHVDGHVKRTKERPLAQKLISEKEALGLFAVLCLAAFILVLFTNAFTIYLSIGGVVLASLYPFMKRHTHLPQVVLGAAFSWAIPMAFAAQTESLPDIVWLLYCANVIWTIVYDTQYAMVDRDDDLKVGIKSTAVLFGDGDKVIIGVLQAMTIVTWILIANQMLATWPIYLAIALSAGLFVYHQYLIRERDRESCFKAFLHNHWVGAVLFVGLVGHYLLA